MAKTRTDIGWQGRLFTVMHLRTAVTQGTGLLRLAQSLAVSPRSVISRQVKGTLRFSALCRPPATMPRQISTAATALINNAAVCGKNCFVMGTAAALRFLISRFHDGNVCDVCLLH